MATALTIYRGDNASFTVVVTCSGTAVNISGCTLRFTVKRNALHDDADAVFQRTTATAGGITITNGAGGLATITVVPANTSSLTAETVLVWDLELTDTAATPNTYTIADGSLTVKLDVTRGA